MPSRNVVKVYRSDAYYHVYNGGVAKQAIFWDDADKKQLLKIIARHLDPLDSSIKGDGTDYRKFDKELELLCYCFMGNHFHFLFYQHGNYQALTDFMRSVMTAYTMYFNRKHERVGSLFQGIYKASNVDNDGYLLHITRYIHLNPRNHNTYKYSSLSNYTDKDSLSWIKPERILEMFEGSDYLEFVKDYEDYKRTLGDVKNEMAL